MTFGSALHAQINLLRHSKRILFQLGVYAIIWVMIILITMMGDLPRNWYMQLVFGPLGAVLCFLAAMVWGTVVWREEGPRSRGYHWSLPIDPFAHDFARVVAGGIALLLSVFAFQAFGLIVSLARGLSTEQLSQVSLLAFISYYTASLLGYMLGAAFATALNRPLEWMVGGFMLVVLFSVIGESQVMADSWDQLMSSRYGLTTAVQHAGEIGVQNYLYLTADMSPWLIATSLWSAAFAGMLMVGLLRNRGRMT